MLQQNTINELEEVIVAYGGTILWKNTFKSWTKEPQEEIVANLWGCIIYGQTVQGYLQPCWVHCEHSYTVKVRSIASDARKYFTKSDIEYVHSVFQFYPKDLMHYLKVIRNELMLNKLFKNAPNYKMFHILNHMELHDFEKYEEVVLEITLNKIRRANLSNIVPKVKVVPEPILYNI